jgi:hypothetical protein
LRDPPSFNLLGFDLGGVYRLGATMLDSRSVSNDH